MKRRDVLRGALVLVAATPALAEEKAVGKIADASPLENELTKYPKCSLCGMDRNKFHRTRHLVHYQDGVAEGTCSIRCLAVSLIQNLRQETQGIYAADFASESEPRPLIRAETASYLIGGDFPTVMSKRPKTAFSSLEMAKAAQSLKGGEAADFDQALVAAYADLVDGLKARRLRRAEREEKKLREKEGA